jgi:hypothetical protein
MYGFKFFAALALALAASTQADHLAVIKTVAQIETGSSGMGSKWCYDGGASYSIYRVTEQINAVGSACHFDGELLASSNENVGTEMKGSYSNGYSVHDGYIVSNNPEYGLDVLFCEEDDSTVLNCPTGTCWTSMQRTLRCDGDWKDFFETFFAPLIPVDASRSTASASQSG